MKYESAQGKACLASDFEEMKILWDSTSIDYDRSKTAGDCEILQIFG